MRGSWPIRSHGHGTPILEGPTAAVKVCGTPQPCFAEHGWGSALQRMQGDVIDRLVMFSSKKGDISMILPSASHSTFILGQ